MGDTLGKYELLKRIARGAIADVFLGRHTDDDATGPEGTRSTKTDGYVAVKRLFPEVTSQRESAELFLDEVRLAAQLEHANIARVHDVGLEEGTLYIAMEYVHGRDLRSVLERGFAADNFIPLELAASVAAQAAAGLHHAHVQLDMVHGDVSPQNILVSLDGAVKVCDFGLAKAEQRLTHAEDGAVKGKFSYMAPEQIEGGEADARSDVFALGIVLYETTTMTRLFKAENQYMALEKILYAGIETPTSLRPGYPADLEKIVMKALERDPAARYQTAAELEEALDGWLAQNKASASPAVLARYMRGLFSEMPRAAADVSMEVRVAPEGTKAKTQAPSTEASVKKDVTEMDEKDLDAALDFALGAPSEADFVTRSAPAEAPQPEEEPTPALQPPQEPEGIFKADYSNDATTITELPEELREEDARAAQQHAAEATPVIVPTVTQEPDVSSIAPEPPQPQLPPEKAPEAAPERAPEPAPTVEAQVPVNLLGTGPHTVAPPPRAAAPTAKNSPATTSPPKARPPASASGEQRALAEQAFGSDAPVDTSFDDLSSVPISNHKPGIIVGVLVALVLVGGLVLLSRPTSTGAAIEDEIARTTIDPADLVLEPAAKAERTQVTFVATPSDQLHVVVNGVPAQVSNGTIPLLQGVPNEVNVFAPGHRPARLVVDGGSTAPLNVELTPAEPQAPVASLDIVSEPRGATVWVDGVQVGTTPTTATGLASADEHYVRIELDGHLPYAGLIGLNASGEQRPVDVRLEKTDSARQNYVELIVNAVPRGTLVRVDGESEPLGVTPFFKNLDRNRVLTLQLSEVDSAPMRRHLALEDVGTFELRPHLASMKRERGKIVVRVEPSGPNLYVGPNAYGQGPTKALEFPEGKVAVVVETASGRLESTVDVLPNAETTYVLRHGGGSLTVEKR